MNITNATPLILTEDKTYPLYLRDVKKANSNLSFPQRVTEDMLVELGYATVTLTERPIGDVVTEGKPEEREGVYYQTWNVRSYTEEELSRRFEEKRQMVLSELKTNYSNTLAQGTIVELGEQLVEVQTRDTDLGMLLVLKEDAKEGLAVDSIDKISFRTTSNEMVELTCAEVISLVDQAIGFNKEVKIKYWEMQKLVKEAVKVEDFPVVPETIEL